MPDSGVKISSLPSAAAEDIQGTDVLAGVSDDATKKFTFTNILTWIKARLSKSDVGLDNVANVLQYSASNPPPTPTKSDIGLGNVDNVQQYSASNPPPYPVTSVNGQIGAVSITIPTPASPSDASPAMDGTAAAGSSPDFARGDHVHPTDTSRQATINVSGVLAGDGNGGVAAVTVDSSPDTSHTSNLISSAAVAGALTGLESDLAAIHATGTTNTTGAAISSGTYFYLNGALVQAKENIGTGAPFTSGTNYAAVTAGGLNDLKAALSNVVTGSIPLTLDGGPYTTPLTSGIVKYMKYGRVTQLYIDFKIAADATSSTSYFYMDLPAELTGLSGVHIFLPSKISNNGTPLAFATAVNTRLYVYLSTGGATPTFATAGQSIEASGMYMSAT